MNENGSIVAMEKISKWFGGTKALDGVNLAIPCGRIIGLLGANGAGKSTLLRTIIGLYLPDEGRVTTFGTIYPNWNEHLERRYIMDFEINTGARVGSLSPGERQKVAILIAIGFEPELLILDEPASALDPIARARFLDLLLELIQTENRTIVISSHILSDVEKVIDHVVIMDHGRIICDRNFDELREQYHRIRLTALHGPLPAQLPFAGVLDCRRNETEAILTVRDQTPQCIEDQARAIDCEAEIQPLPLEDIYRLVVKGM
jgi:ABC-2 type transport system ATP-binding protein